jgi:transposase InsO family protein
MKKSALRGLTCGGRVRTTVSDHATPYPLDHVYRKLVALRPSVLWVLDLTYVATQGGLVDVAFAIDA